MEILVYTLLALALALVVSWAFYGRKPPPVSIETHSEAIRRNKALSDRLAARSDMTDEEIARYRQEWEDFCRAEDLIAEINRKLKG